MYLSYSKPDNYTGMTKQKLVQHFSDKVSAWASEQREEQKVSGSESNLFEDRVKSALICQGCDIKFYSKKGDRYGSDHYIMAEDKTIRFFHHAYMMKQKARATPIADSEVDEV